MEKYGEKKREREGKMRWNREWREKREIVAVVDNDEMRCDSEALRHCGIEVLMYLGIEPVLMY